MKMKNKIVVFAAAILLRVLGYEAVAEQYGGYPTGYVKAAGNIGLFDGAGMSGAAPRWGIAVMAYNALEAEIYDISNFSGEGITYEKSGKTVLTEMLGMNKIEGVVTANDITSINASQTGAGDASVRIETEEFTVGSTDISNYLGYYVKAYYRDDYNAYDDREIKLFFVNERRTKTLEIEYDKETTKIEHSGSTIDITYNKDGRSRKVSVKDEHFIYNGMLAAPEQIDTYFMPKISSSDFSVILIDNDGDNKYDVIQVRDYASYLVTNVNIYSEIIRCKTYTDIQPDSISLNGKEYTIYNERGQKKDLSAVKMNNVISIFNTIDDSRCDIYISAKSVKGAVTRIEDGECEINSDVYTLAAGLPENLFSLGLNAVYYIDIYGKIAGYDEIIAGNGSYGLLMNVMYSSEDDKYLYKILTSEGEMKTIEGENEVIAYNAQSQKVEKTPVSDLIYTGITSVGYQTDSEKYAIWHTKNAANFIGAASLTDYSAPFYSCLHIDDAEKSKAASRKPVYFELDSQNKMKKILVPDIPGETRLRTLNNAGRYSYTYRSAYSMAFDSENNTTATPYYRVDSDAIVFSVLATDYEDNNYAASKGTGKLQNGIANKMRLYATDNTENAGIVVNYSILPDEGLSDMPYVIVRYTGIDDNGNTILYGYSKGKEYSAAIADGTRLIERKPNFSGSQYTDDTKLNNKNIPDGMAIRMYDAATIDSLRETAVNSPLIETDTLKRGDIVIVGKNGGADICYVEMAMRASDGVMLISSSQSSYYSRMSGADYLCKGTVTEITDSNEFLVDVIGEYNSANRRQVSPAENYRYTLLFNDRNVPYAFDNSANVWIYDYALGHMEIVSASAIEEGDTVMIRGAASKPKDCIIIKNYPN